MRTNSVKSTPKAMPRGAKSANDLEKEFTENFDKDKSSNKTPVSYAAALSFNSSDEKKVLANTVTNESMENQLISPLVLAKSTHFGVKILDSIPDLDCIF